MSGDRRLFFALWPDAQLRQAIIERRRAIEGLSKKRVPDHNLHMTLVFLGNQPESGLQQLLPRIDRIACQPFVLELDRFGWFARAGVAWLGGPAVSAGAELVRRIAAAAIEAELAFDFREWLPHVTLFRRVSNRPVVPRPQPLTWPVDRFSLIESIPGRPYQVLRTWPVQSH